MTDTELARLQRITFLHGPGHSDLVFAWRLLLGVRTLFDAPRIAEYIGIFIRVSVTEAEEEEE